MEATVCSVTAEPPNGGDGRPDKCGTWVGPILCESICYYSEYIVKYLCGSESQRQASDEITGASELELRIAFSESMYLILLF